MQQLQLEKRRIVEEAVQRARLELRCELAFAGAPHPSVAREAGVPTPANAVTLFGELERRVLRFIWQ